jgi:hypothetical protein
MHGCGQLTLLVKFLAGTLVPPVQALARWRQTRSCCQKRGHCSPPNSCMRSFTA